MFGLGWLFFAIGMVGVVLPVLPTTPLLILSLWAFSRSSRRFQIWLYTHRIFGKSLQRWHTHRMIPMPAKIFAISIMSLSFAWLVWGVRPGTGPLVAAGGLMLCGGIFLSLCPSRIDDPTSAKPPQA
jgi:uncharacterized membrane protein YbaN (DUF454 family)